MARTAYLVCLISTVGGLNKNERKKAKNAVLLAGTQQTLGDLFIFFKSVIPTRMFKQSTSLVTFKLYL
jgi:hypothetical protein